MHRRHSALAGSSASVGVAAWLLPLYVVPASVVVMTTVVAAATEDSGQLRPALVTARSNCSSASSYLFPRQLSRPRQTRAGARWRAVTVFAPLRAARVAIEAVAADIGTRPAGVVVVVVWSTGRQQHSSLGIPETVVLLDSRASAVHVGGRLAPSRCRVPYWRGALPWRRRESRVTAESA